MTHQELDKKMDQSIASDGLGSAATVDQLRASLAAIHYNCLRPRIGGKIAVLAQMAAIVDECERCIPELKQLRP